MHCTLHICTETVYVPTQSTLHWYGQYSSIQYLHTYYIHVPIYLDFFVLPDFAMMRRVIRISNPVAFLYHTSGATRYIYMLCTVLYLLCMYWYQLILVGRHKIIYIHTLERQAENWHSPAFYVLYPKINRCPSHNSVMCNQSHGWEVQYSTSTVYICTACTLDEVYYIDWTVLASICMAQVVRAYGETILQDVHTQHSSQGGAQGPGQGRSDQVMQQTWQVAGLYA